MQLSQVSVKKIKFKNNSELQSFIEKNEIPEYMIVSMDNLELIFIDNINREFKKMKL